MPLVMDQKLVYTWFFFKVNLGAEGAVQLADCLPNIDKALGPVSAWTGRQKHQDQKFKVIVSYMWSASLAWDTWVLFLEGPGERRKRNGEEKAIENNCKVVFYHVGNLCGKCIKEDLYLCEFSKTGRGWRDLWRRVGAALLFLRPCCHSPCFTVVLGKYRAARCFSVWPLDGESIFSISSRQILNCVCLVQY